MASGSVFGRHILEEVEIRISSDSAAEVEVEQPNRDTDAIGDENVVDNVDSVKESLLAPAKSWDRNPYDVDHPSEPRRSQHIAEKRN